MMWKGGGAEGRFRDQWKVVSEGVKGCQKGGIASRVFLLQYHINCIVLLLLLKTCFAFFILIGEGRKCKNVLVVGFVV